MAGGLLTGNGAAHNGNLPLVVTKQEDCVIFATFGGIT